MGKKISLELPKFRLELHAKLVKRRKPLLAQPLIPTAEVINKKYKKGTFVGRVARYFADHKNIRKMLAGGFAVITIAGSFIPQTVKVEAQGSVDPVIESQTDLNTQVSMQYPLENIKINQGYSVFHHAIDFGGPIGTPIKPIMPGVVSYAGWDDSGYGNLIVLDHQNNYQSFYAHLSKIEVKTGETVGDSTEIGKIGITGNTTGPHLHFEIHQNGVPLNPLTVLAK
jgi:murein DD-endopeptidase MepM/ murein hydrolase activator NlpD